MLSKEQKERIVKMYQEGYSIADIAIELKHGKNTINRYLQNEGICRSKNKFSEEVERQIVEEYLDGKSLNILGEKYGCDAKTIQNILKRADVERRNRGNSFKEISQDIKNLIKSMWDSGKARWEISNELKLGTKPLIDI